jgi:hypothetical protein
MNAYIHVLRMGLVSLALVGTTSGATGVGAQSVTSEETVGSVRRMLDAFRTTASSITSSSESIAALSTSPATASRGG